MIRRILVAVDFRQPSLAAARWAVSHLGPAALELAHVSAVDTTPALRGLAATLRGGGISVRTLQGTPHVALAERARTLGADLVVLGRDVLGELRGRTLERLIGRVGAPVLAIGGLAADPPHRVLAAGDISPLGSGVVRCASHLARRLSAEITLLPRLPEDVELRSILAASNAGSVVTVVGRHDGDAGEREGLGSTARRILGAAPGPVLVVPGADAWLVDGSGRQRPTEPASVVA